jgi:hypothetical protein
MQANRWGFTSVAEITIVDIIIINNNYRFVNGCGSGLLNSLVKYNS